MRRGPAKGLETKSYRDPEHPIQEVLVAVHHDDVRTRQAIARFLTTISYHNLRYKFARFLTGESMQAHRRTRVQYLRTGEWQLRHSSDASREGIGPRAGFFALPTPTCAARPKNGIRILDPCVPTTLCDVWASAQQPHRLSCSGDIPSHQAKQVGICVHKSYQEPPRAPPPSAHRITFFVR
jgi:hypothetical protein